MKKILNALLITSLFFTVEAFAKTKVAIETNKGTIVLELFDKEAPKTTANFLSYIDSGFYKDTIFHRVIEGFVIQGGGFTKELAKKDTKKPVKNEAKESLKNVRGTIAMARLSAPDSATSQFFINVNDNTSLDWRKWNVGYAVFGKVIRGMRVVEDISFQRTGKVGMYQNVPEEAVIITNAYRLK
jgi:peptidyl-prolyl cis-trans isomerase A (cyclophilin A)